MQAPCLFVIIGPTGVGKTEVCIRLAQHFGTEIISADSRQMYADIPIGTAAPTPEQQARVPHHMVGHLSLDRYYSAARYEADVLALLAEKFTTHPCMILSGGSMMYVDALCYGIDDIPTVDATTRATVWQSYHEQGIEALAAQLKLVDPAYYARVDVKNPKRVVHALEIYYMTGKPYSSYLTHAPKPRPFRIVMIGLQRERDELYDRINRRVDAMMHEGLLDEVRKVYPMRHYNSLNTVGYKELFAYLDGECTLPFAIEKIKQHTRIYARKQLTWYRKRTDIAWFHPDQTDRIIAYAEQAMQS